MKHIRTIVGALAIGAASLPAHAIPVTFDVSGTVRQHSLNDWSTGVQTDVDTSVGIAWSAQFIVETDLLQAPTQSHEELARLLWFNGLAGAVTPSLILDGVAVDVARFNTDSSQFRVADSNGFIADPGNNWSIMPDQWGVNFRSAEVTSLGTTAVIDFQMGFVDFVDIESLSGGTTMLSLDGITAGSVATLPLDNPAWFRDVEYWFTNYHCVTTCVAVDTEGWSLGVTSVTRTVGVASVPEPGTLALMLIGLGGAATLRRRRAAMN